MSSTTGLRAGDLPNEITRLRTLMQRHLGRAASVTRSRDHWRNRATELRDDRDYWRQRALTAERPPTTKGATP